MAVAPGGDPAAELGVGGADAGVDDVGADALAGAVVGVGVVQRQVALVDPVQAPGGRRLGGGDRDPLVGLDVGDVRVAARLGDRRSRTARPRSRSEPGCSGRCQRRPPTWPPGPSRWCRREWRRPRARRCSCRRRQTHARRRSAAPAVVGPGAGAAVAAVAVSVPRARTAAAPAARPRRWWDCEMFQDMQVPPEWTRCPAVAGLLSNVASESPGYRGPAGQVCAAHKPVKTPRSGVHPNEEPPGRRPGGSRCYRGSSQS